MGFIWALDQLLVQTVESWKLNSGTSTPNSLIELTICINYCNPINIREPLISRNSRVP